MMNYETTNTIINNVINSVDFSKVCYLKKDDIDFSVFDLHDVPKADFTNVDSVVKEIEIQSPNFEYAIKHSRLRAEKKEAVLKYVISNINIRVEQYKTTKKTGDLSWEKYNQARTLYEYVNKLSEVGGVSVKEKAYYLYRKLKSSLKQIEDKVSDRFSFLNQLTEKLIEESYKHQVNNKLKNIESTGLTIEDIRKPNSEEFFDACCNYAFNKFGKGASDTISAIHYQRDKKYPETNWKFNDSIEGCLLCAKNLGVKEIAFVGDSTAALSNLNTIMKLGFSFRIEELTKKRYGEEETYPAAIVSL